MMYCLLRVTEIQISQENNVPDIKQQSDTYEVYLNLEGDRYKNIGFFLSKTMEITKRDKSPGLSILKTIKDSFFSQILLQFYFFIAVPILLWPYVITE